MTSAAPPTSSHIVRSSAVVGVGTALSRITGFLRVSALAAFGFARLTDVYNVANSTPNIVYELLLGGVLTATLVPLYVEHHERGDDEATDALNTAALSALFVVTLVGLLVTPLLVRLYSSQLHGAGQADQRRLTTVWMFMFMPQVFFYGVTALATGMLNARRRFAAAAFVPVLNNLVVIGILLAVPHLTTKTLDVPTVLHDPLLVTLLGLGTTAGIVAMAIGLLPALRRAGIHMRFLWAWRHPAVRTLMRLSGWTVGYVIANQIAALIVLVLSYRRSGDASVYIAAYTFFQLPHGLFSVSIMTAVTPELSSHANRGDTDGLRDQFGSGLRLMLLVVAPAAVALIVLARPIINATLDYGSFTAASAALTARTLTMFGVGLVFFSAYLYTLRGFYAMQDTRTPFMINCVENAVNIVFAFLLYPSMGVRGLALAWSIAYAVAAVLAVVGLRRRLHRLEARRTLATLVRAAIAAAAFGVLAWALARTVGYGTPTRAIAASVVSLGGGGAVYLGTLLALRVDDVALLSALWHPGAGGRRV